MTYPTQSNPDMVASLPQRQGISPFILIRDLLFVVAMIASISLVISLWGSHGNEISCLSSYRSKLPLSIHGVAIHYCYNPQRFFSNAWLHPPISGQGGQVSLPEGLRVVPAIENFVRAYSRDFLTQNLQDIYLLGEMIFYGQHYGGTYSQQAIYIEVHSVGENYTNDYVTSQLHAEFSSILIHNYPFPWESWTEINDPNFKYSENPIMLLGEAGLYDQNDNLLNQGFINQYSTTDVENDFNDMAFLLFNQSNQLCDLAERYSKISAKVKLVVAFYQKNDPEIHLSPCYKNLK